MKIILNIIKWGMVVAGIVILTNMSVEQGKLDARSRSRMTDIIIDPNSSGYLNIYDNYEYTESIFLNFKDQSDVKVFEEKGIKLYIKRGKEWDQLELTDTPRAMSAPIKKFFHIGLYDPDHKNRTGTSINLKYEANLDDKRYNPIILEPSRLFCGMEFLQFLPKFLLGAGLILAAFLGECIWFTVKVIMKRKADKRLQGDVGSLKT